MPAPFGPTSAVTDPAGISSVQSRSAQVGAVALPETVCVDAAPSRDPRRALGARRLRKQRRDVLVVEAGSSRALDPPLSDVRKPFRSSGGRDGSSSATNVPTPRRATTSPSRSSSRYALRTVFGLIASAPTTSFTVGS